MMLERNYNADHLADFLISLSWHALSLPSLWEAGALTIPVAGPHGQYIGKLLPGRGFLLADDLQNVRITKPLPHVYERSLTLRLWDLLKSERGAITTYAGLLAARAAQKHRYNGLWTKTFTVQNSNWAHVFTGTGTPGAGAFTNIPGGSTFDQTSAGALNYGFAQPTNPDKAFLVSFSAGMATEGYQQGILIDLLVGAGNIDTNTSSAQTVNTTALTRTTDGVGVLAFTEVTSTLSSTASSLTLNRYTNQAGTTLHSSPANAMIANAGVNRIPHTTLAPFFGLQAGDYGMRSVEEVTFSAAMGGTGKLALSLCKPLMWMPGLPAGFHAKRDDMSSINGATELALTSGNLIGCLSLLFNGAGSGAPVTNGDIEIAIG